MKGENMELDICRTVDSNVPNYNSDLAHNNSTVLSVSTISCQGTGPCTERSKFVNNDTFYLYITAEPKTNGSNCIKDMIYMNGFLHSDTMNVQTSKTQPKTNNVEIWIPDIVDEVAIGIEEGWSYSAKERQFLGEDIEFTTTECHQYIRPAPIPQGSV